MPRRVGKLKERPFRRRLLDTVLAKVPQASLIGGLNLCRSACLGHCHQCDV
jgi:hypothetical protein